MTKKILHLLIALIITISICKFTIADSNQAEDIAQVRATVLGFDIDESNNALILLKIDGIIDYFHNKSATYEPLKENQSVIFGFLWGHREVTLTNVSLEKGDRILARVGYHQNFTSHNGHLYRYEKICEENEIKIGWDCFPTKCNYDEHLVNSRCVKLNCKEDEKILNNSCVDLNCSSDEITKEHECIKLECNYDEYPINSTCKKLVCSGEEEITNHTCSKLNCNIFQKATSHKCALNWNIILGSLLFSIIVLFLWYEELLNKIKKSELYKKFISNELYISLFIVVFTILLLITPLIIRAVSHEPLLIGEEPYLHARIAQDLLEHRVSITFDHKISLYHLLLTGLGSIISVYFASVFIPPLLGILSIIVLIQILKRLEPDMLTKNIILIILVISPAFIYLFTFSTPATLAVFFTLVGINLLMKNKKLPMFIGTLFFLLASLTSLFNLILCFGIFLFLVITKTRRKMLLSLLLILLLLLTLPYYILNFTTRDTIYQFQQNIIKDSITSFGALIGFSVFNLFLTLFGFIFTWKKKARYAGFYLISLALIIVGLILNQNYNMYWNFVIAYLSGIGFVYLLRAEWELKLVKQLTILVIVCGLIFSTISYTKLLVEMQPSNDVSNSLKWLEKEEPGLVLSHYSRGYWIEYISKKQAFVDDGYYTQTQEFLNVSNEIFYSRNLVYTKGLLNRYNITYIFIDEDMKEGLVWIKEEQGLLFLFRNNETFKKLYLTPNTEIWRYVGE